jgi:hypothetical protein
MSSSSRVQVLGKLADSEARYLESIRELPYEWRSASGWDMQRFDNEADAKAKVDRDGGWYFRRQPIL